MSITVRSRLRPSAHRLLGGSLLLGAAITVAACGASACHRDQAPDRAPAQVAQVRQAHPPSSAVTLSAKNVSGCRDGPRRRAGTDPLPAHLGKGRQDHLHGQHRLHEVLARDHPPEGHDGRDRRHRRPVLPPRHGQGRQRQPRGHLQRLAALHLRRGLRPRRGARQGIDQLRRNLVRAERLR